MRNITQCNSGLWETFFTLYKMSCSLYQNLKICNNLETSHKKNKLCIDETIEYSHNEIVIAFEDNEHMNVNKYKIGTKYSENDLRKHIRNKFIDSNESFLEIALLSIACPSIRFYNFLYTIMPHTDPIITADAWECPLEYISIIVCFIKVTKSNKKELINTSVFKCREKNTKLICDIYKELIEFCDSPLSGFSNVNE
jgi:hypothetical protein